MALSQEVRRFTADLREAHRARMESLATLRDDAARYRADLLSAHQQMASALTRDFAEWNAMRRGAESDRRDEMAQAARQRAAYLESVGSSVASMRAECASKLAEFASELKELRNDFGEAHRAWTEFAAFMRRARATASVAAAAGRPAAPAEPLSERVLRFLGEQSAGQRLGELQKALGVPRRQLARLMDELVEAGKAKLDKQGVYFTRR